MNRKGIERKLVVVLFVLVLVVFSFAERDSRKLGKMYSSARFFQSPSAHPPVAAAPGIPIKN